MAKKKTKRAREGYKLPLRFLWGFFILGILTVFLLFGGAALGLYGPMPDLQQLENPKTNLASQIISSDGAVLGKYYFDDNYYLYKLFYHHLRLQFVHLLYMNQYKNKNRLV